MEGHLCYAALLGALGWVRGRHRPGVRPTTGAATVTGNTSFADARDGDNNTATSTGRPTGSTSQFGNDRAVLTDIRRRIPCQRHRPRRKREVKAILDQSASDNDRKYLLHSTFENEGHQGGPAHEPLGWPCLQAHRSRSNPPASRERAALVRAGAVFHKGKLLETTGRHHARQTGRINRNGGRLKQPHPLVLKISSS